MDLWANLDWSNLPKATCGSCHPNLLVSFQSPQAFIFFSNTTPRWSFYKRISAGAVPWTIFFRGSGTRSDKIGVSVLLSLIVLVACCFSRHLVRASSHAAFRWTMIDIWISYTSGCLLYSKSQPRAQESGPRMLLIFRRQSQYSRECSFRPEWVRPIRYELLDDGFDRIKAFRVLPAGLSSHNWVVRMDSKKQDTMPYHYLGTPSQLAVTKCHIFWRMSVTDCDFSKNRSLSILVFLTEKSGNRLN